MKKLLKKINQNKEIIGVFGLGYVGLPLALNFSKKKIKVFGFDVDQKKINYINKNKSYLSHIKSDEIKKAKKNGFTATRDFKIVEKLDVIIICVPTPLKKNKHPDLSYILNTLKSIERFLKPNQLISLESTTYPGTTNEIIAAKLIQKNLIPGENFFLSFSPERLDRIKTLNVKDIQK